MTLRNNDTQALRLRKKTVQRFSFILNLIGAGAVATLLLDSINVKCILRRSGREHILFHENLLLLAIESMYYSAIEHALQKTVITLAAGTQVMLPLLVDLGYPVNLLGDDELSLEVTTKTGWMGTYDAASSSLEVEDREAIGVETVIPMIKSRSISATHSRVVESLGDNVTSITLVNTEATRSNSTADAVFESLIISSDKYSASDNRGRLLSRRASQFENVANASLRRENFKYVPAVELDDVEITIEMNGANVAATKNYIVYRTYVTTREVLQRAAALNSKHANQNEAKLEASL
jgi:hypothetical protein